VTKKITSPKKTPYPAVKNEFAGDGKFGENTGVTVRNAFGQKLLEIRNKAINKGMKLKNLDEVLSEIADDRQEL
jgi:hypothetical protein